MTSPFEKPACSEAQALAQRLGAKTGDHRSTVHLTQTGRMRVSNDARWTSFKASQSVSVTRCAFDWRARTGAFGLQWIRDSLDHGEGSLSVKALGLIPLARFEPSAALTQGQLIRYLAELPLAPDAILRNNALVWRSLGSHQLSVSSGLGENAAEVTFTLDDEGMVADMFALRPRAVGSEFKPTPWLARFSDYRLHEGRRLPFRAEVTWKIEGTPHLVWQGRMTDWQLR
ncbi:MAG: DUF6544 family protein [Alphaproteobacteria bacterium]